MSPPVKENNVQYGENQAERVIFLDPGNRTFLTGYNPSGGLLKIGNKNIEKLIKLLAHMDKLISKTRTVEARKRNKYRRAQARIQKRVYDLRREVHEKTASYLAHNYDIIIIPILNTHAMCKKRRERRISSKTVRGLMTWAHGEFRTVLSQLAEKYGKKIIWQDEAYTSKTCSFCGWIDENLGSKKEFQCQHCQTRVCRDINGAGGIFLRAFFDKHICFIKPVLKAPKGYA